MCQIDNQKFGMFIAELRKEKHMTQKELADKLYVSDRTISKWERGAGMPQVSLLLPLAEHLNVTVTELLKGERMEQRQLAMDEVNRLLEGAVQIGVSKQHPYQKRRKKWMILYFLSVCLTALEICFFLMLGVPPTEVLTGNITTEILMLTFGFWACVLAKETLPRYYDENKINYFTDGFMHLSMPGLHFNNRNWIPVLVVVRIYTMAVMLLNPILFFLLKQVFAHTVWEIVQYILVFPIVFGLFIPVYTIGRKYEKL